MILDAWHPLQAYSHRLTLRSKHFSPEVRRLIPLDRGALPNSTLRASSKSVACCRTKSCERADQAAFPLANCRGIADDRRTDRFHCFCHRSARWRPSFASSKAHAFLPRGRAIASQQQPHPKEQPSRPGTAWSIRSRPTSSMGPRPRPQQRLRLGRCRYHRFVRGWLWDQGTIDL